MRTKEIYHQIRKYLENNFMDFEEVDGMINQLTQLAYSEGFIDGLKLHDKKHNDAFEKMNALITQAAEDSDEYSAIEEAERIIKEL